MKPRTICLQQSCRRSRKKGLLVGARHQKRRLLLAGEKHLQSGVYRTAATIDAGSVLGSLLGELLVYCLCLGLAGPHGVIHLC